MNNHIVVEQHTHAVRNVVISVTFAWAVFFAMGYGARPIIEGAWDRWIGIQPITVACVPEPKPKLTWGK